MGKVYILSDEEKASLKALGLFVSICRQKKPDGKMTCILFGFATGSTPERFYVLLIQVARDGELSFAGAQAVNLDEYVGLLPSHKQSYAFYLTPIYKQLGIDMGDVLFPTCCVNSQDEILKTCLRMERWIEKHGPVFIWILGIGENGHMAFIEPSPLLPSENGRQRYHAEELSDSTLEANSRNFGNDKNAVPDKAITAGVWTIEESEHLIQLAFGPKKQWPVTFSVLGPMTPLVPSSLLQDHPDWNLVIDREAGEGILGYLGEKKIRPDDQGFYRVVSEAGISHQIQVSREIAVPFGIPTRTQAEETADLR